MESAPLPLARTYARKAAFEAQKAEINRTSFETAREQHELAAGEFANARNATHDREVRLLWKNHTQTLTFPRLFVS
jgi:hypothetical protein